ncbi:MAG: hypothetical protein EOP51_33265, partial [Sphingobacteriales bacterium]
MKNKYFLLALMAVTTATVGTADAQECLGTGTCAVSVSQYPTATQTTSSTAFVAIANDMYAGEFALCNVTAGVNYQWSLCSADGGNAPYDSQLSLYNGTTNVAICYSDDNCGDDAKIGWTATFTGTVKIQVTEYDCIANTTPTTLVWRTMPAVGPDAAVGNVYTMGTISSVHSNPHVVSARINNSGSTTFTSLPVTLTVSGANTFTNTQTIPSLAPGATVVVTFTGYSSTATGTNSVTVSLPADNVTGNNTMAVSQVVNTSSENYAYGSVPTGGVGYPTGAIEVAAKYYANAATSLSSVIVPFQVAGSVFKVKVYNGGGTGGGPGSLLYTS